MRCRKKDANANATGFRQLIGSVLHEFDDLAARIAPLGRVLLPIGVFIDT